MSHKIFFSIGLAKIYELIGLLVCKAGVRAGMRPWVDALRAVGEGSSVHPPSLPPRTDAWLTAPLWRASSCNRLQSESLLFTSLLLFYTLHLLLFAFTVAAIFCLIWIPWSITIIIHWKKYTINALRSAAFAFNSRRTYIPLQRPLIYRYLNLGDCYYHFSLPVLLFTF